MIFSALARTTGILIKEQFREPIVLFWHMVVPGIFYAMIMSQSDLSPEGTFAVMLAYLCGSMALYTSAVVLIARRESGFLKAFAYIPGCYQMIVSSQIIVSVAMGLSSMIILLVISVLLGKPPSLSFVYVSAFIFTGWLTISSFGACSFMCLSISMRSMSTISSIFLFILLTALFFGEASDSPMTALVASFNPLSIISWSFDYRARPDFVSISLLVLMLAFAGFAGLLFPVIERKS